MGARCKLDPSASGLWETHQTSGPPLLVCQEAVLSSTACITGLGEGLLRCDMAEKKALEEPEVCRTILHGGSADMLLWSQKTQRQKADRPQSPPGALLWNQDQPLRGVQGRAIIHRARPLPR